MINDKEEIKKIAMKYISDRKTKMIEIIRDGNKVMSIYIKTEDGNKISFYSFTKEGIFEMDIVDRDLLLWKLKMLTDKENVDIHLYLNNTDIYVDNKKREWIAVSGYISAWGKLKLDSNVVNDCLKTKVMLPQHNTLYCENGFEYGYIQKIGFTDDCPELANKVMAILLKKK